MRVAQLTAQGRGAIASIAVEGPQAVSAVASCFHGHATTAGHSFPIGRIRVGIWLPPTRGSQIQGDAPGEELVVCRTAEERVEIHCHGGAAAVRSVLDDLKSLGGCLVESLDLADAPVAGPVSAAALQALTEATTERTALILLEQYHGALQGAVDQLRLTLSARHVDAARQQITDLLRFARFGLHLTRPWQVVLAGLPNVGKSSLINALVGFQRAVVFDTPGTTRDVVTVPTAIDGWPIELSDTAGLRATDDSLENLGMQRAVAQLRQADLVLWVCDATRVPHELKSPLTEDTADALLVINKWDRAQPVLASSICRWTTSAVTGEGLAELTAAISARLVPQIPSAATPIPFTEAQVRSLHKVESALLSGDVTVALAALSPEFVS